MRLAFVVVPRLLLAVVIGTPALVLGVFAASFRLVSLALAEVADRLLEDARGEIAKAERREDKRPALDQVDTP